MPYVSNQEKGSNPDGRLAVVRCLGTEQSICRCFNKWRGWAESQPQETASHLGATPIKVSSLTSTGFCWKLEKALGVGMLHESRLASGMPQVIRMKYGN